MLAVPKQHLAMHYKFSVALTFTASMRFGLSRASNFARLWSASRLPRCSITDRVSLALI